MVLAGLSRSEVVFQKGVDLRIHVCKLWLFGSALMGCCVHVFADQHKPLTLPCPGQDKIISRMDAFNSRLTRVEKLINATAKQGSHLHPNVISDDGNTPHTLYPFSLTPISDISGFTSDSIQEVRGKT